MNAAHFTLIENGKTFFLEGCKNEWATAHGATHEILLQNGEIRRACRLLKTVAYVFVDESADGMPVAEKWLIRNCHQYTL